MLAHPLEEESFSRTGERDVSVALDSSWLRWIDPLLRRLYLQSLALVRLEPRMPTTLNRGDSNVSRLQLYFTR